MKKFPHKSNYVTYTLGQLISIVGSCAKDDRETVAAVADLLSRGTVAVIKNGQPRRVRLS
jgi:hypothetical protein